MKILITLCLAVIVGGAWAEPPATPSLGATLQLTFPELPPPMESQATGVAKAPQVYIRLPDNYASDHLFPLLLFLDGNSGGVGDNAMRRAVKICGGRDFVCVGLPLFASPQFKDDGQGGQLPVFGIRDVDAALIWHAYATILKKIYASIPNLEPEHSVIGGFSNGAHTIGVLLNRPHSALEIGAYFRHIFLVEGGYRWTHLEEMKRGHLLILQGALRSPSPMDDFVRRAQAAGLSVTPVAMQGVAHAFPDEHDATVRHWIDDLRLESSH